VEPLTFSGLARKQFEVYILTGERSWPNLSFAVAATYIGSLGDLRVFVLDHPDVPDVADWLKKSPVATRDIR
jgi:hypothetical protein